MSWLSFHGGHFFSLIYPHFANFSSKMGKVKVGGDFGIRAVVICYVNALIGGSQ